MNENKLVFVHTRVHTILIYCLVIYLLLTVYYVTHKLHFELDFVYIVSAPYERSRYRKAITFINVYVGKIASWKVSSRI